MSSSGAHATPKDAKVMAAILKDAGVQEYEPRVISQMLEFAYKYTSDILEESRIFSEHAGKRVVDSDDVKMAIANQVESKFTTPPPKQLLADIAKEKNSEPLPAIKQAYGLHLPPDRYSLLQPNYRLKRDTQTKPSVSAMDTSQPAFSTLPRSSTNVFPVSIPAKRKMDEDYDNY